MDYKQPVLSLLGLRLLLFLTKTIKNHFCKLNVRWKWGTSIKKTKQKTLLLIESK